MEEGDKLTNFVIYLTRTYTPYSYWFREKWFTKQPTPCLQEIVKMSFKAYLKGQRMLSI